MFKSTTRTLGVLGGVVALFLLVGGIGMSTGVVKLTGAKGAVGAELEAGATAADPADTIPVPPAAAAAPEVTVPPVTVAASAVVKAPPTTNAPKAPKATKAAPVVEAAVVAGPAPTVPPVTVPALAARTVPSAAQVQSAIQGITGLVQLPLFVQITPANVADVGNRVCTAFDQGQTFAQVKATGLSMVSAYVPVSDAAADYAVRKAVELYCPGYASKLV
jgi:hypothetical protein